MSNNITLTASMRNNLSALKTLTTEMGGTQTKLATGKKVNSAIDNASSYYQARSLNNRAADLDALLDAMGQGIQTINAASEGIEAGLQMIEQMQSVAAGAAAIAGDSSLQIDSIFNGRANTQAIVDQIGENGIAAYATTQFYVPGVSADDENFGQGKWYLPALGELMDAYGEFETIYYKIDTDMNEIEISQEEYEQLQKDGYFIKYEYNSETGEENLTIVNQAEYDQFVGEYGGTWVETATGGIGIENCLYSEIYRTNSDNTQAINATLALLADQGVDATALTNDWYWSSSENHTYSSWLLNISNGYGFSENKIANTCVRAFSLLENKFSANATKPELGDVMYSDLSYGSAEDYDSSKTAVGVVTWVSDDGSSARIMNLKDLTFSSDDQVGNFDPAHPYSGSVAYTQWATNDKREEDISGVENITEADLVTIYATSSAGRVPSTADLSGYQQQFNAIYQQYDNLIKDASYQGINLLNGNDLQVMFNESRNHSYTVRGQHADAASLGLAVADWHSGADVAAAISQLQKATDTLRAISTELGNSYAILTTRQEFTDAIIDILQTGADDLVLADMNEESANYLALQTRQQLAVNSLSLASQAASAVLKLF